MPDNGPCETLWIYDPSKLLGTNLQTYDLCVSNNINAFTRAFLLGLLVAAVLSPFMGLSALVLVLLILILLYGRWLFATILPEEKTVLVAPKLKKEGFEANIRPDMMEVGAYPPVVTAPGVAPTTRPTAANPFMNVLLDEIKYNPTRPSADPIVDPNNKIILDDFFRIQWNSDPTDVFGRSQSQRQFYTMPSTSIPNDQGSFQNWLYLIPGKTCKEGNRDACYPATNGAPVTWLSQPN